MPFPRNPRFRRAENFAPMEITARDAEILRMVNRHRFLRSHQIADLVTGSRQQVLRRLQKLYHHGYLERPACQLDYYQRAGSRSIAYGLASRGAAHLRRTENIPFSRLDWTSRNRTVKRLFLEHALMVSDIMVSLEIACRKRGNVHLLTNDEIPLPAATHNERDPFRWTVRISQKEKVGVIPDCIFVLEFRETGERILVFLEADRATMPVQRARLTTSSFARKLLAYQATWMQGVHRAHFGFTRVRMLTVTNGVVRLGNLIATASELGCSEGLFLFGTADDVLSSEDFLALPWKTSTGSSETLFAR
jgi:DNA-binding Lrp family transcriptional regulator